MQRLVLENVEDLLVDFLDFSIIKPVFELQAGSAQSVSSQNYAIVRGSILQWLTSQLHGAVNLMSQVLVKGIAGGNRSPTVPPSFEPEEPASSLQQTHQFLTTCGHPSLSHEKNCRRKCTKSYDPRSAFGKGTSASP